MPVPIGRAEYLDDESLKKANIHGDIESALWKEITTRERTRYPDFMFSALPGYGKTFLIKKKIADGALKADYYMLDKQTLKYKKNDNGAKICVIDDLNYLVEVGRYNEIMGNKGFNTSDACHILTEIYKEAKNNNKSVILVSSEDIHSLSLLMRRKDKKAFLRTFGWAIDPASPLDIIQEYRKITYKKLGENNFEPSSEIIKLRKDFVISPGVEDGKSLGHYIEKPYENISKDFHIVEIPSVIPHSKYSDEDFYVTEWDTHMSGLNSYRCGYRNYGAIGKNINKIDQNDFIDVNSRDYCFKIEYFDSSVGTNFPVGHIKYDWKMTTTPRKLEITKHALGEISPETLGVRPKSQIKKDLTVQKNIVRWSGNQIDVILHQIDQVCWAATRTESWQQLINDLAAASTKKDYQRAYLKSTITRQHKGA